MRVCLQLLRTSRSDLRSIYLPYFYFFDGKTYISSRLFSFFLSFFRDTQDLSWDEILPDDIPEEPIKETEAEKGEENARGTKRRAAALVRSSAIYLLLLEMLSQDEDGMKY